MSSDDSISLPLTARLESFDESGENGRDSPSPHTMFASSLQNGSAYHHYANPQQLKDDVEIEIAKIDGRKKKNLLYDSVNTSEKLNHHLPPRNTKNPSNNNIVYVEKQQHKKTCYKYILIFTIVLVMTFFASAVVFFVLSRNGNDKNSSTPNKSNTDTAESVMIEDATMHQLQHNITHIKKHVIPSLQEEIFKLSEKVKSLQQKKELPGPKGPKGPPGVADFNKCSYKTYVKKNRFNKIPEISETISTYALSSDDKFIMGVTCSTKGAAQYNLFQTLSDKGERKFACKCAGKSKVPSFKTGDNYMYCRIHYWECPMTS